MNFTGRSLRRDSTLLSERDDVTLYHWSSFRLVLTGNFGESNLSHSLGLVGVVVTVECACRVET